MQSRSARAGVLAAAALAASAPAAAADARGGALYTGHAGRATTSLGVTDDGRSIPAYAFFFRHGRCTDGRRWDFGEDQAREPDIDVSRAGRFTASLADTIVYTHFGQTHRVRVAFHVAGRFSGSGRTVSGTFRETAKARHGAFACRSGAVHFSARAHGTHPGLTIEPEEETVAIGDRIDVDGRYVTGDRGTGQVAVFARGLHGGAETQVATGTLTRSGRYSVTIRPDHDARYRVAAVSADGGRTAHSVRARVLVSTASDLALRRRGARLVARWSITGHHVDASTRGPKVYFYFRRTGERRFHRLGAKALRRTAHEGFTSTLTAGLSFRSHRGGTASVCVRRRPFPDMHGFVPKKGCGRASLRF
jgi:hypothetical protein